MDAVGEATRNSKMPLLKWTRSAKRPGTPKKQKALTEMDAVSETTRHPQKAFTEIDAVGETTQHPKKFPDGCSAARAAAVGKRLRK